MEPPDEARVVPAEGGVPPFAGLHTGEFVYV